MNAIFAWVSQGRDRVDEAAFDEAARWLTFVPETTREWSSPDRKVTMRCWSICDEAARGGWSLSSETAALTLAGWFRELDEGPLSSTLAEAAHAQLDRVGVSGFHELSGNYALVFSHEDGTIEAFTDPWCAEHIFYGRVGDRVVVSNRAAIAASLLFGELPGPRPESLAWLLSGPAVPVADDDSAWAGIRLLRGGRALKIRGATLDEREIEDPSEPLVLRSYDEAWERLCWTAKWIERLPDVEIEMAITGGFDSRAVLAGVLGAEVAPALARCYLKGHRGHADVLVGQALAKHYGLEFDLRAHDHVDEDVFEVLERHLFQTELLVNAWDLKGTDEQTRVVRLHGNMGELYRGHGVPIVSRSWSGLRRYLRSSFYLDKLGVLSRDMLAHLRGRVDAFIEGERAEGCEPRALLDHAHRRVRAARWVGQVMQFDSAAGPNLNILPDPVIHRFYRQLPYAERQQGRIHFELTRRADDWLWRQPFAGKRWHLALRRGAATQTVRSTGAGSVPRQLLLWRNNEQALRDFLLADSASAFFEVVDRERLTRLVVQVGPRPTNRQLRTLLATAAVRLALESKLKPRPFRVRARPS